MSAITDQASTGFSNAEGRFQGAFNAFMSLRAKSWDPVVISELIAGLQRQSQALVQLARAMGEMDDKLNAIKVKLGIP